MFRLAVIIPAYNESSRIVGVLRAIKGASIPSEIIVVDDGSADNTSEAASTVSGVKVITLTKNVGKGGAMAAGVASTDADIVMFVDADLQGLTAEHVDQIAAPMIRNECDMCVGVFRGGKIGSNAAMAAMTVSRLSPISPKATRISRMRPSSWLASRSRWSSCPSSQAIR